MGETIESLDKKIKAIETSAEYMNLRIISRAPLEERKFRELNLRIAAFNTQKEALLAPKLIQERIELAQRGKTILRSPHTPGISLSQENTGAVQASSPKLIQPFRGKKLENTTCEPEPVVPAIHPPTPIARVRKQERISPFQKPGPILEDVPAAVPAAKKFSSATKRANPNSLGNVKAPSKLLASQNKIEKSQDLVIKNTNPKDVIKKEYIIDNDNITPDLDFNLEEEDFADYDDD